ncbi:hypothetical protein QFC21_004400 [Naganishia friedmannii]|uniref:Uncharacterized protein n=1 Tax=Naganishia friedmannii TaxID=89922 RepID=A0ACC2VHI7_9TREE|nr:hypothetical protein QFC21_004400 [Naganishia friedmannii]
MMFAIKSSWIAVACTLLFLMQDGWAHVGTRTTHGRYNLQQRNSMAKGDRTAGCGTVNNTVAAPYAGQCVCFDESTSKAIFGQTSKVVSFANQNNYTYPHSTTHNGNCNLPSGGSLTLLEFDGDCCSYKCSFGSCGSGTSLICLEKGQICQSGVPVSPHPTSPCPTGRTQCFTAKKSKRNLYECIDTQSDLESCGGCIFPDPAAKDTTSQGVDCSAISNVKDVSCEKGKCNVKSCEEGYYVADNCCKEEPKKDW